MALCRCKEVKYATKLPRFDGPFSWDRDILITSLSAFQKDYCVKDPWTWPLITDKAIHGVYGKEYDGEKELPGGVAAYETETVRKAACHESLEKWTYIENSTGEPTRMQTLFHHFPYHYSRQAAQRNDGSEYLTGQSRMNYISDVSNNRQEATEIFQPTRKATTAVTHTKGTLQSVPKSSDKVFKEVLQMVAERDTTNHNEVLSLKKKLSNANALLTKERAIVTEVKSKHQKLVVELLAKFTELNEAHSQATKAEEKNKVLEQQLKTRDGQLVAARKEAKEANERMNTVWSELKKGTDTTSEKRKVIHIGKAIVASSTPKRQRTGV